MSVRIWLRTIDVADENYKKMEMYYVQNSFSITTTMREVRRVLIYTNCSGLDQVMVSIARRYIITPWIHCII